MEWMKGGMMGETESSEQTIVRSRWTLSRGREHVGRAGRFKEEGGQQRDGGRETGQPDTGRSPGRRSRRIYLRPSKLHMQAAQASKRSARRPPRLGRGRYMVPKVVGTKRSTPPPRSEMEESGRGRGARHRRICAAAAWLLGDEIPSKRLALLRA
ncbi:hypothetical protein LX36DRAFT_135206 [Colletotrichum falcatum]|nr:hypothetical protein LX36DRAFT_135206 [Colletotrichum falcatum]